VKRAFIVTAPVSVMALATPERWFGRLFKFAVPSFVVHAGFALPLVSVSLVLGLVLAKRALWAFAWPRPFWITVVCLAASAVWAGLGGFLMFVLGMTLAERRPFVHRILASAAAALMGWAILNPLRGSLDRLEFRSERPAVDLLVREVVTHPQIQAISDFGLVNSETVGPWDYADSGTTPPQTTAKLRDVLMREGIDEAAYWGVRRLLTASHYRNIEVEGDYVALIESSLLDNISGVVLARNGRPAPAVGARFLGADVTRVSALGDGWYRFSTT
jgi:hypothetical protein